MQFVDAEFVNCVEQITEIKERHSSCDIRLELTGVLFANSHRVLLLLRSTRLVSLSDLLRLHLSVESPLMHRFV